MPLKDRLKCVRQLASKLRLRAAALEANPLLRQHRRMMVDAMGGLLAALLLLDRELAEIAARAIESRRRRQLLPVVLPDLNREDEP